jgi:bis(5'-nucleosyl)-tetraphosphatase (symmetrical)
MSTYIIGDVQGCFDALMALLEKVKFNDSKDKLIFCGDLVNRGGQSLETLRWIYAHQQNCQVTLGNHDLSLLAQYYVKRLRKSRNIEFQQIFNATDCSNLMNWLRNQNLLIHDKKIKKIIVHAGIYPLWSLKRAKKEARFVEFYLQNNTVKFFKNMYGAQPNHWSKSLFGMDRARFAVNSLTRMRFLFKNNGLNFKAKGEIESFPKLIPWFRFKPYTKKKHTIIIGHWSALGLMQENNVICLDTGKVWGGKLTALKISDNLEHKQQIFQV